MYKALVIASTSSDPGYRQIYEMTKGAIFLGTPHKGATISRIGRVVALTSYWMGSSIKLLDLLDAASIHNREIGEDYLQISTGLRHIDFYEMLPEQTFGIPTGIVSRLSRVHPLWVLSILVTKGRLSGCSQR